MKPSSILLAVSLAANAALIVVFALGASDSPAAAVADTPRSATNAPAKPSRAAAEESWTKLSALDLSAQRDRLQADGVSPKVLRAILAAEVRERFAARRKALDAPLRDAPFWKNPVRDPATLAAMRALDREEQQAIKDVLGEDKENGPEAMLRRQFPSFSEAQVQDLAAIRRRYDEQRQDLMNAIRGVNGVAITLTPDDSAKMRALEKTMHQEFASVLSPEQMEEYDLRLSNSANNLRYNTAQSNFEWTEAEFRAVYRLRAAYDEEWNMPSSASQEQARARMEAQRKLDSDIAAALGPERAAEYQRASDYNFRQASALVARLELPPETANQLYDLQKSAETQRQELFQNIRSVEAAEAARTQAAALLADAQAKVLALLGPRGAEAYKTNGGSWLQNLALQARPVPRPAAPKQ